MLKYCFRDIRNQLQVNLKFHLVLCLLKMPFYAVAIGKTPGVYTTWIECENQTKGYPKAKYRKFNNQAEALSFVKSMGAQMSEGISSTANLIENLKPPEMSVVGKYGSKALLKQDKLDLIVDKLEKFMDDTNKRLNEISERLESFEMLFHTGNMAQEKRKLSSTSESDIKSPKNKKKKTNEVSVIEVSEDEDDTPASLTRIRSTHSNGSVEEIDAPFNNYNISSQGFMAKPDGFVIVYTDGACSNNGRNNARAGLGVWFGHNNPFNVAAPVVGAATNNNAEIQAATRAIEQAQLAGINKLDIHTDSQFMINCITNWMKKWKKNNWVTSNGGPVKNKEQLQILDRAIRNLEAVRWTHVRGHVGNEGNECADSLARAGASMS